MLVACARASGRETGGILVGHYTDALDCAVVTRASRAPSDSKRGATWFVRGVRGLQRWISRLWHEGRYYLGEWHSHPGTDPTPSAIDIAQMRAIAGSSLYRCPEPILVIVGGGPRGGWCVNAVIVRERGPVVELGPVARCGLLPPVADPPDKPPEARSG